MYEKEQVPSMARAIGYGAAAPPTPEGGISDRVNRCLTVAEALGMEVEQLAARLVNPGRAEINAPAKPEPEPSHLVFALEKLERTLDRVRRTLNLAAEAL